MNDSAGHDPAQLLNADDATSAAAAKLPATQAQFVAWLRDVAPYVHAHRGKTFVVAFGGELVEAGRLNALVQDLSLVHAMGVRLVVIHGSRPQVQAQLKLKGLESHFAGNIRITDTAALECAKEASGEIRLDIEAAFSQGLPNTPMAHSRVRIVSGNFVTARPFGVVDGVDFKHTGVVRKVDGEALRVVLGSGAIVLLSPLGFSPTGEAFNLTLEDIATSVAVALKAEKLVFVSEIDGVRDRANRLHAELSTDAAERLLNDGEVNAEFAHEVAHLIKACRNGVARAHLIPFSVDGSLLVELFTHDGIGSMLANENMESLRDAGIDDVGGILQLLAALEADGTLVKRPRELIEREIERFSVLEHDGRIYGCAALYPFADAKMGEMAALTVHADYQNYGDGERLLKRIEARARALGLARLFVLTTRTAHWFIKRGFVLATVDSLPVERQRLYNWQRRSQILIKQL